MLKPSSEKAEDEGAGPRGEGGGGWGVGGEGVKGGGRQEVWVQRLHDSARCTVVGNNSLPCFDERRDGKSTCVAPFSRWELS